MGAERRRGASRRIRGLDPSGPSGSPLGGASRPLEAPRGSPSPPHYPRPPPRPSPAGGRWGWASARASNPSRPLGSPSTPALPHAHRRRPAPRGPSPPPSPRPPPQHGRPRTPRRPSPCRFPTPTAGGLAPLEAPRRRITHAHLRARAGLAPLEAPRHAAFPPSFCWGLDPSKGLVLSSTPLREPEVLPTRSPLAPPSPTPRGVCEGHPPCLRI